MIFRCPSTTVVSFFDAPRLVRLRVDEVMSDAAFAAPAIFVTSPTKAKRPWLARGETYRLPGSFKVTLTKASATQAEIRFR